MGTWLRYQTLVLIGNIELKMWVHVQTSFTHRFSLLLQVVASSGERLLSRDLVRRAVNEALTVTAALHTDLVVHGAQEN